MRKVILLYILEIFFLFYFMFNFAFILNINFQNFPSCKNYEFVPLPLPSHYRLVTDFGWRYP